jgi:hypothetical protein
MLLKCKKYWKPDLPEEIFHPMIDYMSRYQLSYLGYGGTCLSYIDPHNIVYKICLKENNVVLQTPDAFLAHCNSLRLAGVNILPPIDIVFDNEHFIVYTQDFCNPISKINSLVIIETLRSLRSMIQNKYKLTDIYYRNYGIYHNKIVIYDYHDHKEFDQIDHTYICHLAHMFSLYYHGSVYESIEIGIEDIIVDNFCSAHFQDHRVSELFKQLYRLDFDAALTILNELIEKFKDLTETKFEDYQFIGIDREGQLNLSGHTKLKYQLANIAVNLLPPDFTAIDCGCSLGGIGCKIAHDNPLSHVTLNNLTTSELLTAEKISQWICINNVSFNNTNIVNDARSYDLTMYFALVHHLLKDIPFIQLIQFIHSMTNKYAVMDVPLKGDALLDMIMANGNLHYNQSFVLLESVEIFQEAIKDYFTIVHSEKIEYGSSDLNRHGFVLKKI